MPLSIYIARQPILAVSGETFGYELLFRSLDEHGNIHPVVNDGLLATARVLVNALNHFGIDRLVGDTIAFINIDEEFLLDDIIFNIPSGRFILEILEDVPITPATINRIKELKEAGYRLALDDANCTEEFIKRCTPVFPYIDILKLDLMLINLATFKTHAKALQAQNFKLLAEKVETKEQYELFKNLGCSYFQGYYFAKPDIMEKKSLDPAYKKIFQLINMLDKGHAP